MTDIKKIDVLWDDNPVDISAEANFIWSIANKLRGTYMPDKYGDVIIPMTIIRRFECVLAKTRADVVAKYKENPNYPAKAMYRLSGYQFYNVSEFTLQELCNDADHIAENFKAYIQGFSDNQSCERHHCEQNHRYSRGVAQLIPHRRHIRHMRNNGIYRVLHARVARKLNRDRAY